MKNIALKEAIKADALADWEVVTKVVQYAYNVGYEQFLCDLGSVLSLVFMHKTYADEMWQKMRSNFGLFYCNLDNEAKKHFVEVALKHYGYAPRID